MKHNSLRTIWVLAKSNYKEVIRDRLLYGVLVVALLVTASSFFLSTISFAQDARVLEDVGLAAIHLFTLFICIFVATNSVHRDFERRALYLLLPKPISRAEYVLGKYLGLILLMLTTLAMLGAMFCLGVYFTQSTILLPTLKNLAFSVLEISLLTALALLFATFTAPLNAALYTSALFIIGRSLTMMRDYAVQLGNVVLIDIMKVVYYLLPNLEKFDMRRPILYGLHIPADQVIWSIVYWLLYTGLALFLAVQVMKKQEV